MDPHLEPTLKGRWQLDTKLQSVYMSEIALINPP